MSEIIYKDPNRFYVYAYLREDRTPYYIGKGSGGRIKSTRRIIKAPFDKARIVILKESLTEQEAFDHEIELIKFHGRKDNGTGILRNLTDGGEGSSGYKTSDATKEKLREAQLGKIVSDDTKEKIREANLGKIVSDDTKEKLREANLGKKHSDATKEKIREAKLTENLSDATREKMREAASGENNHNYGKKHSDDAKEKMREARLGKKHSDATKEKLREAQLGRIISPETIAKRNESRKRNKEAKLQNTLSAVDCQLSDVIFVSNGSD